MVALLGEQVDLRPIGTQETRRVGDGALQDGLRLVQRGDLRGDLGQRALGVDPVTQLLVEARVRDRDGRLAREQLDQLEVGIGERDLRRPRGG